MNLVHSEALVPGIFAQQQRISTYNQSLSGSEDAAPVTGFSPSPVDKGLSASTSCEGRVVVKVFTLQIQFWL